MRINQHSTDQAVLSEVGERVAAVRLGRNMTQARLAETAGVSKRTVERMESGESVQLTSLIRVLRALDLTDRMNLLLPEPGLSPMAQLESKGKERRRASGKPRKEDDAETWTWGE